MGYSGSKYLQAQTLPGPDLLPALVRSVPGPKCSFVSVPGYAVFPRVIQLREGTEAPTHFPYALVRVAA